MLIHCRTGSGVHRTNRFARADTNPDELSGDSPVALGQAGGNSGITLMIVVDQVVQIRNAPKGRRNGRCVQTPDVADPCRPM
jgi:hypothetical protein